MQEETTVEEKDEEEDTEIAKEDEKEGKDDKEKSGKKGKKSKKSKKSKKEKKEEKEENKDKEDDKDDKKDDKNDKKDDKDKSDKKSKVSKKGAKSKKKEPSTKAKELLDPKEFVMSYLTEEDMYDHPDYMADVLPFIPQTCAGPYTVYCSGDDWRIEYVQLDGKKGFQVYKADEGVEYNWSEDYTFASYIDYGAPGRNISYRAQNLENYLANDFQDLTFAEIVPASETQVLPEEYGDEEVLFMMFESYDEEGRYILTRVWYSLENHIIYDELVHVDNELRKEVTMEDFNQADYSDMMEIPDIEFEPVMGHD